MVFYIKKGGAQRERKHFLRWNGINAAPTHLYNHTLNKPYEKGNFRTQAVLANAFSKLHKRAYLLLHM